MMMNWLDFAIIITVVAGAFFGIRTGIIRAGFAALAVILGMFMVGEVTGYVSVWFGNYVKDEALIRVIGYAFTIALSVFIAAVGAMLVRKCVYAIFLGWTDRLAGLALGLVVAVGISGAAIVTMADLAENPEVVSSESQETTVWESTWQDTGFREALSNSLVESSLVPTFSVMIDSVPADNLDFVPANFRLALDNLRQETN